MKGTVTVVRMHKNSHAWTKFNHKHFTTFHFTLTGVYLDIQFLEQWNCSQSINYNLNYFQNKPWLWYMDHRLRVFALIISRIWKIRRFRKKPHFLTEGLNKPRIIFKALGYLCFPRGWGQRPNLGNFTV